MDSLDVLRLQRLLKKHLPNISLNTIYSNTSINTLNKEIEAASSTNNNIAVKSPTAELAYLLEQYQKRVELIPASIFHTPKADPATIIVTGTTGALGTYVINSLLQIQSEQVTRIYYFNRLKDAKNGQVKNCQAPSLKTDILDDRMIFRDSDLSKQNFRLQSRATYDELLNTVMLCLHNTWPVNFNLSLTSFMPSVDGVIGLIDFAAASPRSPIIQFFSSVSSVNRYPGTEVPEHILPDLGTPELIDHGQLKYLSERLLDYAAQHLGINTISVRTRQVASAARTATSWNRQEWLPSLVVSSTFISALPAPITPPTQVSRSIGYPWTTFADVLVKLGLNTKLNASKDNVGAKIYQITHPHAVPWAQLLPAVQQGLRASGMSSELPVIPYVEWYELLKAKSTEAEENTDQANAALLAHNNPAMKLMDFFWGMQYQGDSGLRMKLAMEKTLEVSQTLRNMEQLKPEWMAGWTQDLIRAPWRGY